MEVPKPTTLKDSILIFRDYLKELPKRWYWYLFFGAIFYFLAYQYLKTKSPTYTAKISFMTTADQGGGASALAQIAGQLGLGGGGGGTLKSEKVLELLISKRIVYNTLLKKETINGKEDLLFNHYLDIFKVRENAADSLQNFKFTAKSIDKFSYAENSFASQIYNDIVLNFLQTNAPQSGIMTAYCKTSSEVFSKVFLSMLVETLADFYIRKSAEQQRRVYNIINERVDSIYNALINAEYAIANWIDDNNVRARSGTLPGESRMKMERLESTAEVLGAMYEEAVKNREIAHLSLLNNTPVLQVIDYPAIPLPKQQLIPFFYYAVAIISSFFIATVWIVLRKLVRDAMNS